MKNSEIERELRALVIISSVRFAGNMTLAMHKNKKMLTEALTELNETRTVMCKQYAEKDEKGEAKIVDGPNGKVWDMTPENKAAYDKEFIELLDSGAGIILEEYNFTQVMAELVIRKTPEISMDEIEIINGLVN